MYKTKLVKIANSIIDTIDKIQELNETIELENDLIEKIYLKQKTTEYYYKLQELFIQKERIIHSIKEDTDSHIFMLKDRYFDNLALGYWEYLYNLISTE